MAAPSIRTPAPDRARRRPAGRRARRRAVLPALAALAATALPLVPGAAPAAHAQDAQDCRRTVSGEELPANSGPYPLIDLLGLRHAWDLSTGSGVTVAVIDSGVDNRHPELDGNAVLGGSQFTMVREAREFDRSTPAPPEDCLGHGTAVAGLVAARRSEGDRMAGVAPGARVYPVRILDGVENASYRTLAAMIDDAVEEGVAIINLSLAVVEDHKTIRDAVARAVDQDILVVAAAGNEGNQGVGGGRVYPAAYPGVLAVGAVDEAGQPLDSSNSGEWIDLAGYGQDLPVVAPGGSGYRSEAGTSMAAAQVSGAAALVRARFPELSAEQVAERLTASAAPVGGGRNDRTGAGIVDPFGALTQIPGTGTGTGEEDEEESGAIPVQPLPDSPPMLSATVATALAVSGGLLLAMVLGLAAAPAVRRAIRRGWHAGPLPVEPAEALHAAPPGEPAPVLLRRLDGSDVPPPAPRGRSRPRAVTSPGVAPAQPSRKRT